MRREQDFFGDQELVLVYMARRLKEALALEEVLNAGALDYAVVSAPYTGGLFLSQRVGAFFYVAPQSEERARALILQGAFKPLKSKQDA